MPIDEHNDLRKSKVCGEIAPSANFVCGYFIDLSKETQMDICSLAVGHIPSYSRRW